MNRANFRPKNPPKKNSRARADSPALEIVVNPRLRYRIMRESKNPTLRACTLLFVTQLFLKGADRDDHGHFWPLRSAFSRRIYTTRFYGPMLRLLDRIHAIERFKGGRYVVGVRSIRYRLNPRYTVDVQQYTLIAGGLAARFEKAMTVASYRAMAGKARGWIMKSYQQLSFPADIDARLAAHPFKSPEGRTAARNHAGTIAAHRPRFYVCPRSGRVYYPVACLPKAIRGALLIDEAPVVELDLSASQPTLLATLYPDWNDEKRRYLAFVQSGRFYEEIAAWAGAGWDRDRAKTEFFNQIAYGSYYCAENYELLPVFRRHFPELVSRMERIKRRGNDALPLQMQAIEAAIVIDGACGECADRSIPVVPVHDSLICRQNDRAAVAEIFARHWEARTGTPAQLKG